MDIQDGDILLISNQTILANMIKRALKCKYSHAGIVMYAEEYVGNNICLVAETTAEGFILKEYARKVLIESENIAGFRYIGGLKKKEKDRLKFEIARRMGREYDTIDLIRLGIYYIFGFNLRYENARKLTCAEAVERCYRAINKPICPDIINPEDITPKDIQNSRYLKKVF